MPEFDYDLFVIGAGSGGVRAARMSAEYGARVAVAEASRVGGTCVIRGCIPKKLLVYAAHARSEFDDAAAFGWTVPEPRFDWATLIANKDREIDRLNAVYKKRLAEAGVELIEARAALADPHTVEVGARRITARVVLIAVGAWPELPPGAAGITSNEAFQLPSLPPRIVVVGGGYVALEFAGIFNGLGAEVVQLYRGTQILRGFDEDVRETAAAGLRESGIDIRVGVSVLETARAGNAVRLGLSDGSGVLTDLVMYATGRRPNTAGMGLAEAGVRLTLRGAVAVDAYSRSSVASVYAIGDCTDRVNLTPVAIREGAAFADTVFGGRPQAVDHACVPSAVFSQPPVACVGLTEAAARARHGEVDVYKSAFRPLKHTLTGRDRRAMMKLVVDAASGRVVGAHMVGEDAPEIIQGVAIAVAMGATKADFDRAVAIHPTAAEEFVLMRAPEPRR